MYKKCSSMNPVNSVFCQCNNPECPHYNGCFPMAPGDLCSHSDVCEYAEETLETQEPEVQVFESANEMIEHLADVPDELSDACDKTRSAKEALLNDMSEYLFPTASLNSFGLYESTEGKHDTVASFKPTQRWDDFTLQLLKQATDIAVLCGDKAKQYGDSYTKVSEILLLLYPEGVPVSAYKSMLFLVRVLDKIVRKATDKADDTEDPVKDIVGYCLRELVRMDNEQTK